MTVNKIVFFFIMLAILLFTPYIQYNEKETSQVTAIKSQCLFDWTYDNYIAPNFIKSD